MNQPTSTESSSAPVSAPQPVVRIDDLSVVFATDHGTVAAVQNVSLQVHPGEVLAIVGESGSGKTVTARSLLGLLPRTANAKGAVWLRRDGQDTQMLTATPNQLRAARGTTAAMVFQEPSTALNPVFTVGWQIAEGLRAHQRISRAQARQRAIEALAAVGIPDPQHRVDHYPHQFSGGQKQRIVIAQALALRPSVIIADEPTTALDVTVQAEILDLLRELPARFDTAIVLITHNMGVVADLADRVAVMYQGRLVEQADVRTLFAAPTHPYTRLLLDAVPRVKGLGAVAPLPSIPTDAVTVTAEAASTAAAAAAPIATPVKAGDPVVAQDLVIRYPGRLRQPGFTAVDGVNLTISAGQVLGLVGESGSGKTTIGRAVAGLTAVTSGSLRVLGQEVAGSRQRDLQQIRRQIGFVFQDPATSFNPLQTIGAAIAEPLLVHGQARSLPGAQPRVDELLAAVHLPQSFSNRFAHELSGGQRQRASLARALALNPALIIADEPTSALDVSVQAKVLDLFIGLQQELGFACLFISHDLAVVEQVSHQIAVLYHGQVVEHGPSAQVLGNPQHPYTLRLLESLPVPDPDQQRAKRTARTHR